MDVSGIASLSTALSQSQTMDAIQTTVLKKAMDIEAQGSLALIQAATQAGQLNNPPHLGNSVDTTA